MERKERKKLKFKTKAREDKFFGSIHLLQWLFGCTTHHYSGVLRKRVKIENSLDDEVLDLLIRWSSIWILMWTFELFPWQRSTSSKKYKTCFFVSQNIWFSTSLSRKQPKNSLQSSLIPAHPFLSSKY